jgi:hypothetical protein
MVAALKKFIVVLLVIGGLQTQLTIAIARESSVEPETKVQISIYDLVKKTNISSKSKLDSAYIKKVVRLIESRQDELTKCLQELPEKDLKMKLSIFPSGKAFAQSLEPADQICENDFFQSLPYPSHNYKKDVTLELALHLSRRRL